MTTHEEFLALTVELAQRNVLEHGGQPFGAAIVKDGELIATGVNGIVANNDPTAHAEMEAVRSACVKLATPRLDGCVAYASGYPCPMCLSAMHQAGIRQVYYAYSDDDCAPYGFSTIDLYRELAAPAGARAVELHYLPVRVDGPDVFEAWRRSRG